MRTQKTRYRTGLFVLLALVGSLSLTGTAPASEGTGPVITPDQTARWWQWAFSIPSSVHPLTLKEETDPTGANYCMVGQEGGEWFLGGIFKTVDVAAARRNAQSEGNGNITPVKIERACEIPVGKAVLIPVLNGECNTAEELALGNDVPKDLFQRARYLRDCAETLGDAIDKRTASAYFGPVDSRGKWTKYPVKVQRVHTVIPFPLTYSPDNVLSSECPDGFLCNPDPNPSLAQADGYWAQVRPLKPGKYKLQTFGKAPEFDFALWITYTLTVVGPKDQ